MGALQAEESAAARRDGVAADVPAGDLRVEGAGPSTPLRRATGSWA